MKIRAPSITTFALRGKKYTHIVYPTGFIVPPEEYMVDGKPDTQKMMDAIQKRTCMVFDPDTEEIS